MTDWGSRSAVPRPLPGRRAARLAERFDPQANALGLMRLVFAGTVAGSHALGTGFGWQPRLGRTEVSAFAVDGFFVLSGFLVARSYDRIASLPRWAWHRFLRIMPGFWVCLLVTAFVVAPVAALLLGRPVGPVLVGSDEPAWRYPVVDSALYIVQHGIGGLETPRGGPVLNGSLWTLSYEAACYAGLGALCALGLLARRSALVGVTVGVWALAVLEAGGGLAGLDLPVFAVDQLLRFALVFLLGAVGWRYADRLPLSGFGALLALGLVAVGTLTVTDQHVVGAAGFAYLVLYVMVRSPAGLEPSWDLSYGLYVYHWPLQFVLACAGLTSRGAPAFVIVSVGAALLVAALSWRFVERPALQLKNWRRATAPG